MIAARDGEQIGDATYAVGETQSFGREPVQIRRVVFLPPVHAEIVDAEIVSEHEDDVRRPLGRGRLPGAHRGQQHCDCHDESNSAE